MGFGRSGSTTTNRRERHLRYGLVDPRPASRDGPDIAPAAQGPHRLIPRATAAFRIKNGVRQIGIDDDQPTRAPPAVWTCGPPPRIPRRPRHRARRTRSTPPDPTRHRRLPDQKWGSADRDRRRPTDESATCGMDLWTPAPHPATAPTSRPPHKVHTA